MEKEVRYRVELFIDVWVQPNDDKVTEQAEVRRIADEFASLRPNTFVGNAHRWNDLMAGLLGTKQ